MGLSERQKGEIAYLYGALGLADLEERVAKLEGNEGFRAATLEERHSQGLANLANLDTYGATPYSPEGKPDPEPEEDVEVQEQKGVVNQEEALGEEHPATGGSSVELDALLDEDNELKYEDLSVAQLQELLRERELPVSGRREELIIRLHEDDAAEEE